VAFSLDPARAAIWKWRLRTAMNRYMQAVGVIGHFLTPVLMASGNANLEKYGRVALPFTWLCMIVVLCAMFTKFYFEIQGLLKTLGPTSRTAKPLRALRLQVKVFVFMMCYFGTFWIIVLSSSLAKEYAGFIVRLACFSLYAALMPLVLYEEYRTRGKANPKAIHADITTTDGENRVKEHLNAAKDRIRERSATLGAKPKMTMEQNGVSLEFLLRFANDMGITEDHTAQDVCDLFVKPVTEDIAGLGSGSMVELVQEAEGFGSSKWGGCPTHMVSYSWSYPFRLVLEALTAFEQEQPLDKGQTHYYFVDQMALNQHKMVEGCTNDAEMAKQLVTALKESIKVPNRMVMILSPWRAPVTLGRAWCLFELFCALSLGATVHMALPPADAADFNRTLLQKRRNSDIDMQKTGGTNVSAFQFNAKSHIGKIDAEHASAKVAADREMIFNEIRENIGFEGFNTKIQTFVEQALQDIAAAAMLAHHA